MNGQNSSIGVFNHGPRERTRNETFIPSYVPFVKDALKQN